MMRKPWSRAALGYVAFFLFVGIIEYPLARAAEEPACPPPAPTNVSVDARRGDLTYSSTISIQEMRQVAAAQHYTGPVVGIYQATIKYAADVDQATRQLTHGGFCAEPEHVILHVEITRTIYIPKEFAADKCLSTLAREHLEKKAKVSDPVLDDAKSKMLAALQAAIRRGPRMPQRSSKEAVAIFLKDIQVSMEKTIDEITAERARLMASVNTQEENRHLATSCNQRALH